MKMFIRSIINRTRHLINGYNFAPQELTNIFGKNFSSGQHLVDTFNQLKTNPTLSFKNSALYHYHKTFLPNSTNEALKIGGNTPILALFDYPWGSFNSHSQTTKNVEKSRFCGPSSNELIEKEFLTCQTIYKSITLKGFKPYSYPGGMIIGTLLEYQGKRKFVVMQGNHRVAALASLGYVEIPVITNSKICLEKVVDTEAKHWKYVSKGVLSEKDAVSFLSKFFLEN